MVMVVYNLLLGYISTTEKPFEDDNRKDKLR